MIELNKINFNKFFLSIISIFLLLFTFTLYLFYKVDKRSDEMIHHKTTLVKSIYNIKFNLASLHLWFNEIASGDEWGAREKIVDNFKNIKKTLHEIEELESSDVDIHHSKERDGEKVLKSIKNIEKLTKSFEKLTYIYLNNEILLKEFNDVNYDADYEILIDELEIFDELIHKTYIGLTKELEIYKQRIYIFITLIISITILFVFYIFKNEKYKIEQMRRKDELIASQYKLASMGEMIDAIAHQWKTPLGIIRMHADYTQMCIELNEDKRDDIKKDMNTIMLQIDHLVTTIDEFRGFFRPNTKLENISIKDIIDSTMVLVKDELIRYNINIQIDCEDIKININQNEFKHVIINLLQNSRDAFIENKIKKRKIQISTQENKKEVILKIHDNAGGISEDIISKIFIPHFTTKAEGKGTGIGLYLSKQIVEKYNASLDVNNLDQGVCFTISFKKNHVNKL